MSASSVDPRRIAPEENLDAAASAKEIPSGKPYEWQLPQPENPQIMAVLPSELIERVLARSSTFRRALERTAAYFVVVSRTNGYEGRDPHVIADDVRCGAVSSFLGIDIDVLGRALLEMQRRGLISTCEDGCLHLDDMSALDALSEGRVNAA